MNSKLKVSVNKNPTKEGIKVQFVMPQTLEGDAKAQATQKLQSKLNQGLEQYNLTVSQDTDVPYANVIGFLIPIADIKLLIKNAIGGGSAEPAPEEAPAPEEPVSEAKEGEQKYVYGTSQPYTDSYNIIFKAHPHPTGTKTKKEIEDMVKQWNDNPNKQHYPPAELKFFRSLKQAKEYKPYPQTSQTNEVNRMQELAGVKK